MNIVISIDGVLRSDTGELITDGLILYRSLKTVGRIILLTDDERDRVEVWLMMHNLADYDELIDSSVSVDHHETLRFRQMSVVRNRGVVSLYVDAHPTYVAEALRRGMTTLLFSCPQYARPEYRPDAPSGIRPWDELVAERTRQQAMKAADYRLKNPDHGGREG
jgi:hypothetical protein